MAKSPLDELREAARRCQGCPLWANATQTVFGAGDPHARVMLAGEQPGDEEDKKGLPFVGPAGRLLDRALEAAGVEGEIKAVKPHVIVALGATAAKAIIGAQFKVSVQRGQFVESPLAPYVFATFHPSALLRLREEEEKETAFAQLVQDLKLINKALG
jgi:DNA polymerase